MASSIGRLFRGKTNSTAVQLVRYLFVGGVAFLVDLGVLVGLTEGAGLHYLVSAAVGFAAGVATNYTLSIVWVFRDRVIQNRLAEFLLFVFLGVVGLGINELTLYLLTGLAGLHYAASKVVATGITLAWNFASRKLLLFTPVGQPAGPAATPEPADAVSA
jgi:putative flippase GtrA